MREQPALPLRHRKINLAFYAGGDVVGEDCSPSGETAVIRPHVSLSRLLSNTAARAHHDRCPIVVLQAEARE